MWFCGIRLLVTLSSEIHIHSIPFANLFKHNIMQSNLEPVQSYLETVQSNLETVQSYLETVQSNLETVQSNLETV